MNTLDVLHVLSGNIRSSYIVQESDSLPRVLYAHYLGTMVSRHRVAARAKGPAGTLFWLVGRWITAAQLPFRCRGCVREFNKLPRHEEDSSDTTTTDYTSSKSSPWITLGRLRLSEKASRTSTYDPPWGYQGLAQVKIC
jgi:hypothetical protein